MPRQLPSHRLRFFALAVISAGVLFLPAVTNAQESASVGVGDTSLELSGETSPYAYVTVQNGSAVIGSFNADAAGSFNRSFPAQTPGIMQLAISTRDATGLLADVAGLQVNLQEHFPTPVQVFLPPTLSLNSTSVSAGQNVRLTGMALPDSTVVVSLDDQSIGTAPVAPSGSWSLSLLSLLLTPGSHRVFATNIEAGGNQSFPTSTRTFNVLALASIPSGQPPSKPVPIPAKPSAPRITMPINGTAVGAANISVAGSSDAGKQIEIWLNNQAIGSVLANKAGVWSLSVRLHTGSNSIKARACDESACSDFSSSISVRYSGATASGKQLQTKLEQVRLNTGARNKITVTIDETNGMNPISYNFVWGDGQTKTINSTAPKVSATHAYVHPGAYTGQVQVKDANGATDIQFFTVNVRKPQESRFSPWLLIAIIILVLCVYLAVRVLSKKLTKRPKSAGSKDI